MFDESRIALTSFGKAAASQEDSTIDCSTQSDEDQNSAAVLCSHLLLLSDHASTTDGGVGSCTYINSDAILLPLISARPGVRCLVQFGTFIYLPALLDPALVDLRFQ